MKILLAVLFALSFVSAVYAQSPGGDQEKLTPAEMQKIKIQYKQAEVALGKAQKSVSKAQKGGKASCFDECLAKDSCGPRPPNPETVQEIVKASEVFIWTTCVAGEMAGCAAGCHGM